MSDAVISYASLILADAGLDVTADNLLTLTKAAGASVDNVWAEVFAKALEGKDIKEVLSGFHAAGPAAPAAGAAAASGAAEEAAEEAAESEKEESDDDMGFGLFD
ncbi:60S acidic ribosomal protein P1-beta [Kluyveromyces marxianus]|uniref:60S acidic ribosomal protein P1-beta n=2 Tax=Kluyveromyces marxianus TaxID=4911 RepID=W0TDQ9_KLUMD|nr:60S acidic ribosomal protein P1-beta [Kluyveromyces marxianus DMKU3-1042]QGN17064.1 60S acidic ribosomal protein P1-beta [Kluyveromyces marxianus]BAO41782.1 60S acidic ribosomal protein P1-beta [Kluyveromyces marxianus DMKU3-1042]BAP73224.1 60S acidic ribosomal protein P1-beta [Kluyveromyces marxianus]